MNPGIEQEVWSVQVTRAAPPCPSEREIFIQQDRVERATGYRSSEGQGGSTGDRSSWGQGWPPDERSEDMIPVSSLATSPASRPPSYSAVMRTKPPSYESIMESKNFQTIFHM